MAFREKSAWVSLLVTLGVYGVYFAQVAKAHAEGRSFGLGGPLALTIVVLVVLQVVTQVAVAAVSHKEARAPADEREWVIRLRASSAAFYMLQTLAVFAAASVYFVEKVMMANLVVAAIAAAQVFQYGAVIVGYRRGV